MRTATREERRALALVFFLALGAAFVVHVGRQIDLFYRADEHVAASSPLMGDLIASQRAQRRDLFDATAIVRRHYPEQSGDFGAVRAILEEREGVRCTAADWCIRRWESWIGCGTNMIFTPAGGRSGSIWVEVWYPCS